MSASHLPLAFAFGGMAALASALAHHGIEERRGWRGVGWLVVALACACYCGGQVAAAFLVVAYD